MHSNTLFYIYDPMCSWCWGYAPVLQQIRQALAGKLEVVDVLGGLAPDTEEAMPEVMQHQIAAYWRKIEDQLGTEFNHSFWQKNTPRRATYPACRAIIAAREQGAEQVMNRAIQEAYYLRAMNPSDEEILLQLADEQGLNFDQFLQSLESEQTHEALVEEVNFARSIGANSFPSWFLKLGEHWHSIPVDYESAHTSLALITELRRQH